MARKNDQRSKANRKEERLAKTRAHIEHARRRLSRSLLRPLLNNVRVFEVEENNAGFPYLACVDPEHGFVWLNPHTRPELGEAEWTFILGHHLLHLGLNHAVRREGREPLIWNLACEHGADNLLHAFKIGRAPHDFAPDTAFAGMREEDIYDLLLADNRVHAGLKTYGGPRKPDLVPAAKNVSLAYNDASRRRDWENLLAEGIREAVEEAVRETADALGNESGDGRAPVWPPAEKAKRWVLAEFPLLGALATEVHILADAELCERMDISVAAINGYLGEMYLHPGCNFSHDELVFVYVHELLHVALLHHSRSRGRDPWLYNIAADFAINAWLVEMGVGKLPAIGGLYDPRLAGMSTEEIYDLLASDPKRCKNLRGFRGAFGDVLLDTPGRRIYKNDVTTLDDVVRRCLQTGMSCLGRGVVPAGLLEEIRSLFTPPVPWDVELARWMDRYVPLLRDPRRTYARASRRQASTPDIPRPARFVPQEERDACTFGVILDTSGSMDRELLGRALGAIASYAEARDVPAVRLVLCDAAPYDKGFVSPIDLRGQFSVQGRGGTVLQPAIHFLHTRPDFPPAAPIMIITDGWCEEELLCPREHCFLLPRKSWKEGALPLRTSAPVFRVLKEEHFE
jgi:predicted metal-dependent peptidase